MCKLTATIFDIERSSLVDGPGLRTTVFFKGCNLACAWCHNPESQAHAPQLLVYPSKCTGCGTCKKICPHGLTLCELCGTCALYCPSRARELCGREYTLDEVLCEVKKDLPFYRSVGGGVTCSGGECMLQLDFLCELLKQCRAEGIHTAVDTAGCVPYAAFERILPYTDLFLYDLKCFDSTRHKRYTGEGNELILENLARLLRAGAPVWVRIPLVPGVNDTEEELLAIKAFLARHGRPEKVELLPYHALGEHKYAALGREAPSFSPPNEALLARLKGLFT